MNHEAKFGALLSMLQLQKWFFRLQNPHWELFKYAHWDILDPDTQQQVGVVRVSEEARKGFFRFGWFNPRSEVHAMPDDSLVLSLYWKIRLWRPLLQVRDSSGELVGYFRRKWFSINGGYWVYDGRHQPAGELRVDWTQYEFRLLNRDGEEIGEISRKLVGLHRALLFNERDFLVTASAGAADLPDKKMMLLAAAIAAAHLRS